MYDTYLHNFNRIKESIVFLTDFMDDELNNMNGINNVDLLIIVKKFHETEYDIAGYCILPDSADKKAMKVGRLLNYKIYPVFLDLAHEMDLQNQNNNLDKTRLEEVSKLVEEITDEMETDSKDFETFFTSEKIERIILKVDNLRSTFQIVKNDI